MSEPITEEIPLELWQLRNIDFAHYLSETTSRRFKRVNGEYVELSPSRVGYDVAEFGEHVLTFAGQEKVRLQKITILYARVAKLLPMPCCL